MTPTTGTADDRSNPMERLEMRFFGNNVTMTRFAWLDLLDEMKPDSETAGRIRALVARQEEEA